MAELPAETRTPLLARIPTANIFEDDWRARPTSAHPFPVVLVHGTGQTKGNWQELGQDLRAAGFAVFAPDFGHRSTAPVKESASQVGAYIEAVLEVTKAPKVILIGHSQGGILARYWMHHLGGEHKTHHLISLSVPNQGTTPIAFLPAAARTETLERSLDKIIASWFGPAGLELLSGSPLITALNAAGDTLPGVRYTSIVTRQDAIVTPLEAGYLKGPDAENICVQDSHKWAIVRHEEMSTNKYVRELVLEALLRNAPTFAELERETPPHRPPFTERLSEAVRILRGQE
ncbi:triacylglycerol lipase [Corynebacterium sp. ES2730-CONJ]|uniref:esterase/lipase family protein n=1 Tax=Corynebacterium sp. ES2730-CONJ TaxID=2973941 RepID=UPI00216B0B89|nr:triacylglycerol lipase [Corynebacterium sp. ES2730-CONJ]MCS4532332.1 triacylglycerol lipase [Corynebacterium sp. ES2730-CONJ]